MRILHNVIILFCLFAAPAWAMSSSGEQVVVQTDRSEDFTYNVELATTPEEQSKGLMYRQFLSDDAGMLFVFPRTAQQNFWMKNTLIPLDLIFIDEFGVIRHIHHNAIPHDTSTISSGVPVKAVLEINGGQAEEYGIAVGDKVLHKVFLAESDIIVY